MWLFFLLIGLTIWASHEFGNSTRKQSKGYLAVMFSVLAFFMMFRGIYVGNDTDNYSFLFDLINQYDDISALIHVSRYEAGYIYLNKLIGMLFHHRQWLFIITGGFTAFSFGRFFYQYSEMPWLSVLMYLTLQFYDLSLSAVRQIVAVSILMFAYDFVIKKKYLPFTILVLIAYEFHNSSILFLIVYPLSALKLDKKFFVRSGLTAVGVFAAFPVFLKLIGKVFPGYIHYLTESGDSYSNTAKLANILHLLVYSILFFVIQYYKNQVDYKAYDADKDTRLLVRYQDCALNIHALAVWLGVVMLFFSLQGTILNRFKYVFSFPLLVAYPNVLKHIEDEKTKDMLTVFSCGGFILYILVIYVFRPEWQSTYPFIPFWND